MTRSNKEPGFMTFLLIISNLLSVRVSGFLPPSTLLRTSPASLSSKVRGNSKIAIARYDRDVKLVQFLRQICTGLDDERSSCSQFRQVVLNSRLRNESASDRSLPEDDGT